MEGNKALRRRCIKQGYGLVHLYSKAAIEGGVTVQCLHCGEKFEVNDENLTICDYTTFNDDGGTHIINIGSCPCSLCKRPVYAAFKSKSWFFNAWLHYC